MASPTILSRLFLQRSIFHPILFLLPFITLFLLSCGKEESDNESEKDANADSTQAVADSNGVVAPPAVGTYPATQSQIQGWIDKVDLVAIRAHGWDIWASITSPSGQGDLPVWETWYSGQDLFEDVNSSLTRHGLRRFESPQQFHHHSITAIGAGLPTDQAEQVTSFNRYSPSLARYIWDNGLNRASTLDSINEGYDKAGTPVIDRGVLVSADSVEAKSISTKPVFQFISGTEPTVVPYWDGISPQTTTNLDNPEPDTWRQGVVVDPTGKLKPGSTVEMSVNGEPAQPLKVVSLDDFYHFTLTQEEVESFSTYAMGKAELGAGNKTDSADVKAVLKAGNIALLVAMHVTTKEIPNWTWQTYWWSPDPQNAQFGRDRPASVKGPWAHYNMTVAYFMVTPPGKPGGDPFVAFNPYLETNLKGEVTISGGRKVAWTGVTSNCMTCHRLAAWQQNPGQKDPNTPHYQPDGFIDPADSSLFGGFTKLDFLWSLTRSE